LSCICKNLNKEIYIIYIQIAITTHGVTSSDDEIIIIIIIIIKEKKKTK